MRKKYQRPEIEFVDLSLSDAVTADGDVESIPGGGILIPDEEEED